ncbi:MAG: adenylosuccinate synthase, partial [Candidatus Tectimicrobiota bacterium]
MPVIAVVGAQWGDEGKGKVVDLLSEWVDIVARYQGGSNAGHTVIFGEETFVLHQIPSGIFRPEKVCIIGTGTVVDPSVLLQELDALARHGIEVRERLWISGKTHLIMPYHRHIDAASEARKGPLAIGTTGRGIGWAYTDKMARQGLRMVDLLDEARFAAKLATILPEKNLLLESFYGLAPLDAEAIVAEYRAYAERLAPMVTNTEQLLKDALGRGETILLEGAQGTMLDVDQGTYPYVTSSTPTIGGACAGLGLPPKAIDVVIGVAKVYTTRVGSGPMPTELTD